VGKKAYFSFVALSAVVVFASCMGSQGPIGPAGAMGPSGPSGPVASATPNPTPTLGPVTAGTQPLPITSDSGATIFVSIDGVPASPATIAPAPINSQTVNNYTVTTGGHTVTLSMSSADEANWGFVNVTYQVNQGNNFGYGFAPPVFAPTTSETVNFNDLNSYQHGIFIGLYDVGGTGAPYSYVEVH
jgi:hypothetical protein